MNMMSQKGFDDATIRAALARLGLRWANCISWNAGDAELYQQAIERGEVEVSATGALVASTGSHTGRSPKDKYIVCNAASATSVWWDANQAMSQTQFDLLKADMMAHARLKSLFVQDLCAGPRHHRACLAGAVHPTSADQTRRPIEDAGADHPLPARLQGRACPPRRAQRDRDRSRP
jgi:ATP-dependent phosphoenolpyruvate carboxykinase